MISGCYTRRDCKHMRTSASGPSLFCFRRTVPSSQHWLSFCLTIWIRPSRIRIDINDLIWYINKLEWIPTHNKCKIIANLQVFVIRALLFVFDDGGAKFTLSAHFRKDLVLSLSLIYWLFVFFWGCCFYKATMIVEKRNLLKFVLFAFFCWHLEKGYTNVVTPVSFLLLLRIHFLCVNQNGCR